jgi:hypothetical protein
VKFGLVQPLVVGGGAGGGGAHQQVQRVLRSVGKARLEGGDASPPVEASGEAADGAERTAGLSGDRAMRATALEAKIGDEGHEIGRGFTGLTLPKTRGHIGEKVES